MERSAGGRILPGVQVLRALAALMVVVHHAELGVLLGFGIAREPLLLVGSAGVDVFFVISGFIMLVSSRRLFGTPGASRTFLGRRLIRIVPLYWAVTSLYVAAFLLAPAALGRAVSGGTMAASYLFWPHVGLDGTVLPVLVVGWTLNYEMLFYALFAVAVTLPRTGAVAAVTSALVAIVSLASAGLGALARPLAFWGDPIVLEFAAGIALGLAFERGWRLPFPAALLAVASGAVVFLWQIGSPIPGGWPRLWLYGLPACLLVGGVALAAQRRGPSRLPTFLVFLGDASYSLYLTHLLAMTAMRLSANRLALAPMTDAGAIVFAGASVVVAVMVAVVSYVAFEKPMTQWLRRVTEGSANPHSSS